MSIEIRLQLTADETAKLKERLRRPERIMKRVGVLLVEQAQRAFEQQAFGSIQWPQRYPNQNSDTLNVAGAVMDLQRGPRIKDRRYEDRPAGRDTGEMFRRLTFEVRGDEVLVGSDVPYAQTFHAGGESRLAIGSDVKHNLAVFLKRKRKAAKRAAKADGNLGPRGGGPRTVEDRRLGFLFGLDVLKTKHVPRPFVGVTEHTSRDIEDMLKTELEKT